MPLRPGEPFGRYRIESLLGEGGMGQVYRATDDRLRRQVALKVMSAAAHGVLGDDGAERLLREARAAAAIDHPNAIAIFDVGEVAGLPFLAMELVGGPTLRQYVGDPSVPLSQRLHWLLAIARALAAAHARGLVHRDIKPENVMVRTDGFVKVLDFGIARAMTAVDATPASAPPSGILPASAIDSVPCGTPLYMSPEQFRGEPLDGRSDQFAWGVVAWELLVGASPWAIERGPGSVVAQILGEVPAPVRARVPEVAADIEAIVARALKKRADERFETTDALVAALERALGVDPFHAAVVSSGPSSVSPSARTAEVPSDGLVRTRRLRKRAMLVAAAALVLVAGGAGAVWRSRGAAEATKLSLVAAGARPAVAILGGAEPGKGDARFDAVAELIATELGTGDQVRVVPRDVTARAARDVDARRGDVSAKAIARLHALTSADYVVVVLPEAGASGALRLTMNVYDANTPGGLARLSAGGGARDVDDLVAEAGGEIRRALGRAPLAPEQAAALRAALPKTSEAAEAYAEGLARMAAYDARGAREALERAVAAENDFALAHLALSRALTSLGFDKLALEEAARALDLSGPLAREQRLVIEAQHKVASKSWDAASELYRTLFGFFPDNLDYGLAFARAQVLGGKRNEAFATLDRLRAVPRTGVEEARIDLMEEFMSSKTADIKRRLAAATEAKRKADALGAPWIGADARMAIGEAHMDLGEAESGARDLEEARAMFEELGDRASVAGVYRQLAKLERKRGDVPRARAMELQGLAMAREVGDGYATAGILTSIAISRALAGELRAAESGFDEARAAYAAIQDAEGVAHNTGNAAYVRMLRGELGGVRSAIARALSMHREIGMKMGLAGQTINLGYAAYLEGDLEASAQELGDALALTHAIGSAELSWDVLDKEARRLAAKDDVAGALRMFDDAARTATQDGDTTARAEIDVAHARLLLDQGRTIDAIALARGAVARFVEVKAAHDEALARAVLVRALVRAGAADEATAAWDALARVLPASELFEAQVEARIAASERAAARGDRDAAVAMAGEARAMAEHAGTVPFALEAGLVEALAMRGAARSEALMRVAADARRRGFLRVARRASVR